MESNASNNPFLFACGVPRSGTTLLQRMLNSHPDLAVANDTHFIPRAMELTDKRLVSSAIDGADVPLSEELANNVKNYHRFYRIGMDEAIFDSIRRDSESYQDLVAKIFDWYGNQAGKLLAGEKTPDYLRRLRLLNGLFPKAKLIHILRDGRNVALSLLNWATPKKGPGRIKLWNENPVAVCALWWKWFVEQGAVQSQSLDNNVYFEIKYEQLTENPEAIVKDVCDFLDLEFDQSMLEFNRGKTNKKQGLSAKSAWLGPQAGLRDFNRDMGKESIELFEALAGETLEATGYELSSPRISPAVLTAAEQYRLWWSEHFLKQSKVTAAGEKSLDSVVGSDSLHSNGN